MIIIKSLFNAVVLDEGTDFAVYENDYPADKFGNPLAADDPALESLQFYEFGDLIIETKTMKYIFEKIYESYQVSAELVERLSEKKPGENLVIDIGTLGNADEENPESYDLVVVTK